MTSAGSSLAERLARLTPPERKRALGKYSADQLRRLDYEWRFWARPNQMPPPDTDWWCWLLLGGRGMGKTRSGSEQVRAWAEEARDSRRPGRYAIVGQTAGDVRDVMIEGESGLLSISPPWWRPKYIPSTRSLTWPDGTQALLFSGDRPNQLRGPQFHKAWVDELAKMQYPQDTWDNLELCLRLPGAVPQIVATTTPRPIPIVRQLLADPMTRLTRGSSFENVSNLSPRYIERVIKRHVGTRLGRQEIFAEILSDNPGALWTHGGIEALRISAAEARQLKYSRIVVGVDPAASSEDGSNETGIIGVGRGAKTGHGYCLADRSGIMTPGEWGKAAVELYRELKADRIVAEVNNGGEMVKHTIHTVDPHVPVTMVHATRGKGRRAEPVSALAEQGKVHHVGMYPELEDQLTLLTPDEYLGQGSPDRADAYVWALTELLIGLTYHESNAFTPVKR